MTSSYLYTFNHDYHLEGLARLESRQLFGKEFKHKLLFTNKKIDPSISPFVKTRLQVISSSVSYNQLIISVKEQCIELNRFNVECLYLHDDKMERTERRLKLKEVGYCIEGYPDFENPLITYAICKYQNIWYFGELIKHDNAWYKHKTKPKSFSNSIDMDIAKTLVSIASKGDKSMKLIDTCCGVGTLLLEGCIANFNIEGCDINPKAIAYTQYNLAHYGYTPKVYTTDIKTITSSYDAAIIDLPYNIYSHSTDEIMSGIIHAAAQISPRLVIVSVADISEMIAATRFNIIDKCAVVKKGKSVFTRTIWICEKNEAISLTS